MSAQDGDDIFGCLGGLANDGRDERRGSDNVEVGHSHEAEIVSDDPRRSDGNVVQLWDQTLIERGGRAHRLGSYTPAFLSTSAKIGTVELTGLEMTRMNALGQALAMEDARVAQIPALICGRQDMLKVCI